MTGASLNAARRAAELDALASGEPVDLVVVGGGITGAGVALDAASRGLSVALLERRDLAHGTSRWSSKLVHGGLRYLEHREWGLAWESARERALLMGTIAPHLVRAAAVRDPARRRHAGRARRPRRSRACGSATACGSARARARRVLPPARRISALEARRLAPALADAGLRGALLSWDGQLEDDARLVVAVARTAAAHGARILTYARVDRRCATTASTRVDALHRRGLPVARAARRHRHRRVGRRAAPRRRAAAEPRLAPARRRPARLGDPRAAVNVPVPGERARWVFALPRADGLVAIGLTDVAADGPVARRARAERRGGGDACSSTRQRRARASRSARATSSAATPGCARCWPRRRDDRDRRPLAPPRGRRGRRHAARSRSSAASSRPTGAMAQDAVDRIAERPCRTAPAAARRAPAPARRGGARRRGSRAASAPRPPRWPSSAPPSRSRPACPSARRSCAGPPPTSSRSRPRTCRTGAPAPVWCRSGARPSWPRRVPRSRDGAPPSSPPPTSTTSPS